ncbi:MAG: 3-isopropylmalate dehydratase small subunit [Roseovarius pacificus]|nr:3-isopropylmalate dehydratase small subunit [Roseovarius pacificus]
MRNNPLRSLVAPLLIDDIDTDQIIPVPKMLESFSPDYGAALFANWRLLPDGSSNPVFVLNRPPFDEAKILLTGENFGCGSSREHAVWALRDFGIQCVIASSYGDIFYENSVNCGLLLISVSRDTRDSIASVVQEDGARFPLNIDLEHQRLFFDKGTEYPFFVGERMRSRFLTGGESYDEISGILQHVKSFEESDKIRRPWIHEF